MRSFILSELSREVALDLLHGTHHAHEVFLAHSFQKLRLEGISQGAHLFECLLSRWREGNERKTIVTVIDPTADQACRLHLFGKTGQQCTFHAQAARQFRLADLPCMPNFMQDEQAGKAHSHLLGKRPRHISM